MNRKTKFIYFHELKVPLAFINSEEPNKDRILNIVNLVKKVDRKSLQIICRDILALKIHYRHGNGYYIVPLEYTCEHFKKAKSTIKTDKQPSDVSLEKMNPFLENFKTNKEKDSITDKELNKSRLHEQDSKVLENNYLSNFMGTEILPTVLHISSENGEERSIKLGKGHILPKKLRKNISLTNRNRLIVNQLKKLYEDKCQICSEQIEIANNKYYSEVHHIQPLGMHDGPDIPENMIVLCPNHHIMFDQGVIRINILERKVYHFKEEHCLNEKEFELKHQINQLYTQYHDTKIFKGEVVRSKKTKEISKHVNYGDIVIFEDEEGRHEVLLEQYHNRHLMNNMQKMLLSKKEGEKFTFNGFWYNVVSIK
ncbi:HNH endonuclease signature motif containing protein [Priestia aryabhattai]|uniref:HNH endonuclease signature motif containing protein n=1 Tax=Priestia aryabhattai TaxID=412384 RepID=UPI001C8CFF0A|nr:HNH endonuclease signature motif containing protein [Priestia aryabhattai]MBX9987166.1 HNH endonuclease [Priestia aryabhattai]